MFESKMTPDERDMVDRLREIVKDDLSSYYDTDFNLLRWLQGHNNDMDSFVRKFRCHLRFRKCWDLDNMHKRPRDHRIQAHWPDGLTGLSGKVDNAIVNIEQAGLIDFWGMLQTYSVMEVMKSRLHDLEMMLTEVMNHEKETGHQASIIYIMDLKGLQFNTKLLSMLTGPMKCMLLFMSDHYVEMIKYFVIVNTPPFFPTLYRILSPLVPERTRNKARVLGSNWRREILDYGIPSQLPDFWNGDGERIFTAPVPHSRRFDEANYNKLSITSEYSQLLVSAGKTEFISVTADAGAKFTWSIFADQEFGFGVFYSKDPDETDEMNMEMLYPQFYRVTAPTIVPLEDALLCEKSGSYKIWLDNKTAWWYSLKIHYKVSVS